METPSFLPVWVASDSDRRFRSSHHAGMPVPRRSHGCQTFCQSYHHIAIRCHLYLPNFVICIYIYIHTVHAQTYHHIIHLYSYIKCIYRHVYMCKRYSTSISIYLSTDYLPIYLSIYLHSIVDIYIPSFPQHFPRFRVRRRSWAIAARPCAASSRAAGPRCRSSVQLRGPKSFRMECVYNG